MKMLSEKDMQKLLIQRSETATLDYKRALPGKGLKTCNFLDLLKDLVGMANTDGGTIVFGVEDANYRPIGLKGKRTLDEINLTQAFETYLGCRPEFYLTFYEWKGKNFTFLTIPKRQIPLVFHKPAQCTICQNKAPSKHFYPGATFIRNGSQTVLAPERWYIERLRDLNLQERKSSSILCNLPGRHLIYDRFVGREENLKRIIELLKDERRRISWISGSGGIGKTALAYRVAEEIIANENLIGELDYLVWVSAKDDALTLSGVEKRQPTLNSLSDLVMAIDQTTDYAAGISTQHIAVVRSASDALDLLNNILCHWTGLLILDNLETLQDEEVFRFLQQLPGKSRALITTRQATDLWGGDTVNLAPMTNIEAVTLIKTEALRCGNSWLEANENAIQDVLEISGRIPLAIRLIVPRLDSNKNLKSYRAQSAAHHSKLLEFCYERTFNTLTEEEQELLFAVSIFENGASLSDLSFMLDVSEYDYNRYDEFKRALSVLWRNSLVLVHIDEIEPPRYEFHNLVREYVLKKLSTNTRIKRKLRDRFELLEQHKLEGIRKMPQEAFELYNSSQDYKGAIWVIEKCLSFEPNNVEALLTRIKIELSERINLNSAINAAETILNCCKDGSSEWIQAVLAIAEIDLSFGSINKALENTIEAISRLRRLGKFNAQLTLCVANCYLKLAFSPEVNKEDIRPNLLESADYAKEAFLQAHKAKEHNLKLDSLLIWAMAEKHINPPVAYQVAELGIKYGGQLKQKFEEIRNEVRRELKGLPKNDLLHLPLDL